MLSARTAALHSPALTLFLQLSAVGVRFKVDADVVLVSPRGVLTLEQREVFRRHQGAMRAIVTTVSEAGVQVRIPVHRERSFRFNVNTDSADAEQRFRPS